MPETATAREKIVAYLESHSVTMTDLAVMYNIKKTDLSDYLSGKKSGPKANNLILRIIADFKIR